MIMAISALDMYDFISLSSHVSGLSYMTRSKAQYMLQESWQHELLNVYLYVLKVKQNSGQQD